jgi:hypothetical protein
LPEWAKLLCVLVLPEWAKLLCVFVLPIRAGLLVRFVVRRQRCARRAVMQIRLFKPFITP